MKKAIIAAAVLLTLSSCMQEGEYATVNVAGEEGARVPVSISFDTGIDVETRSILGDSVESCQSGGVIAVYNAKTGMLDSEWTVSDFSKPLSVKLPCAAPLNFYVAGNMWLIAPGGGKKAVSFPKKEADVPKMTYRMDGGAVTGGRTETFSDAAIYGIPAAGTLKGVKITSANTLSIPLKRLFAKITLTVDHSGLDGGKSVDYFKNAKLYLRQANALLSPFAAASTALSEADASAAGDYDAAMTNGHSLTYTFYAPENKGSDFPTYIEFSGKVNSSAGGYGGTVSYRFYIGSDEDGEKDVCANQNYKIHLGFKVNSLFTEPEWSVSRGSDWNDSRAYGLASNSSGSLRLSEGCTIAVRKGRAANCWLFWNRNGGSTNEASILEACNGEFEPSDLTKAAWWCEAPGLADSGLAMVNSGGKLTFKVSDASKFRVGQEIPVKLHFYPGDLVWRGVVKTYDDISVSFSDDVSNDFYVGMKRTVKVKGLAGKDVYYWNSYGVDCLAFKPSTAAGADWIHNSRSSSQTFPSSGSLDLCAYSNTHGDQFVLKLVSSDTFNDGDLIASTQVVAKQLKIYVEVQKVQLPFDGSHVDIPYCYKDQNGAVIEDSRFDSEIYSQILCPSPLWPRGADATIPLWVGSDGMKIFLKTYFSGSQSIADAVKPTSGFIGPLFFQTADPEVAYGAASVDIFVRPPSWNAVFPSVETEYFNIPGASDISTSAILDLPDDISFAVEKSGTLSDAVTVRLVEKNPGTRNVEWKFSDSDCYQDGLAPIGRQTVSMVFTNRNSGEEYRLSSSFDVKHNVVLRPFAVFKRGAVNAQIFVTTAKNAWMMQRSLSGDGAEYTPYFLGLNTAPFYQYLTMRVNKATGMGRSTETIYRGAAVMSQYSYQDLNTSCYGQGCVWTDERIRTFISSGTNPLNSLNFCGPPSAYTPLPTPLAPSYVGGSQYLSLYISNSFLGAAVR